MNFKLKSLAAEPLKLLGAIVFTSEVIESLIPATWSWHHAADPTIIGICAFLMGAPQGILPGSRPPTSGNNGEKAA